MRKLSGGTPQEGPRIAKFHSKVQRACCHRNLCQWCPVKHSDCCTIFLLVSFAAWCEKTVM